MNVSAVRVTYSYGCWLGLQVFGFFHVCFSCRMIFFCEIWLIFFVPGVFGFFSLSVLVYFLNASVRSSHGIFACNIEGCGQMTSPHAGF